MTTRFDVGDRAVYPAQGVAEVVRIETKEIMGTSQTFYVLSVMDSDKKIMIPVNNVDNVGLRSIISKAEVEQVYDILRERDVDLNQQTWNRRYRAYVEKIQTGSPFEIAEVMRDLNLLKFHKTLSFGERKMLDTARRLLIQEIAVAKDSTEEEILEELEQLLQQSETGEASSSETEAASSSVGCASNTFIGQQQADGSWKTVCKE